MITRTSLDDGWRILSSERVRGSGEKLSQPGVDTAAWYAAKLPATVLGALVDQGVYPDPFTGLNFLDIPGQGPAHVNFSLHPMPEDSPFRASWWYRREFHVAADDAETWLKFLGINQRANIWLNGKLIADAKSVVGAYRTYEFLVSNVIRRGELNVLAIEVFPPTQDDLSITWVDWNPSPPDKNMGLWQGAELRQSGPVALRDAQVVVALADDLESAELSVYATAINATQEAQKGTLRGRFENSEFSLNFELAAGERKELCVTSGAAPALSLKNPRLWWPRRMGEPALYQLDLSLEVQGNASDSDSVSFGVRKVTATKNAGGHTLFQINGKPILIRGGGWAKDLFQRDNAERDEREYEYVKHLGLNAIRFEGMLERKDFIARCDREGMLLIAGWCCCDHWEKWENWSAEDYDIAAESLRSQVRRVRNHPSLIVWWYGSDNPPPAAMEQRYLDVLREERWPNPAHSSASQKPTELTGESGLKMLGPYEYVPPNYWLSDTQRGGAFGFATEISPGPAIPPIESLKAMLTDQHLWPIDEYWTLHCGGGPFKDLTIFNDALAARYGKIKDLADYVMKAQLATYEGERAMFEGYARNKYDATGVIQWMLNNSWPSLIWHLWDWYLRPGGGYFGTKKACEALHVQYSYDDRSIVVVNDTHNTFSNLRVQAQLLNLDMKVVHEQSANLTSAGPDCATRVFELPKPSSLSATHFLRLELIDAQRNVVSRNFYWLSTAEDSVDHDRGNWYYTPLVSHADLSGLANLKRARVEADITTHTARNGRENIELSLRNPGAELAFFMRLRLVTASGDREILPVLWDDNFVSLMPGETLSLGASFPASERRGAELMLEVSGHNLETTLVPLGNG
jgi:exo-1,4-beta-D-glucosaminidase